MKKTNFILIIFFLTSFINLHGGSLKGRILNDDEGLNNVVVYLEPKIKMNFAPPKETAIIDQVNLNFVPHVLPVFKGTKVLFPNSDKMRHSVFSISKIKKFDLGTYPPGSEKSIVCDQAGVIPILCYIHHDMSAYIVVLETPYFNLTNDDGDYAVNNIPGGAYRLSFWHEDIEIETQDIIIPERELLTKNISLE